MNFERALQEYRRYLHREYRKRTTRTNYYDFVKRFLQWTKKNMNEKDTDDLIPEDTKDYKAYVTEEYMQNGNVGRLNAVNNFVDEFLGKPELRISAPASVEVNKPVLDDKELKRYMEAAKKDPLNNLIATLEIDGKLRPSEICQIKIENIDRENQLLYLDDTKTGNNSIILTPRIEKAIDEYLPHRGKPLKGYEEYLIIFNKGRYRGRSPSKRGDFIRDRTKEIAVDTGIKRRVYPYLIKPSAITSDFNNNVNPKIIQRQARHKKIETTLRYDHTSDKMAREYYNTTQRNDKSKLTDKDRMNLLFDKILQGEIDLETFKRGIKILEPNAKKSKMEFDPAIA